MVIYACVPIIYRSLNPQKRKHLYMHTKLLDQLRLNEIYQKKKKKLRLSLSERQVRRFWKHLHYNCNRHTTENKSNNSTLRPLMHYLCILFFCIGKNTNHFTTISKINDKTRYQNNMFVLWYLVLFIIVRRLCVK